MANAKRRDLARAHAERPPDLSADGAKHARSRPGWHKYWDGNVWHDWESLGGQLSGSPTLATGGSNRLDAFIRGTDNSLFQRIWDGASWSSWQALGGELGSRPAAVAWSSDRLDPFAAGDDEALHRSWWHGNWHP